MCVCWHLTFPSEYLLYSHLYLYINLLCHESELQLTREKKHCLAIYVDCIMPPLYEMLSCKYHNGTVKVLPIIMDCVTSNEEG